MQSKLGAGSRSSPFFHVLDVCHPRFLSVNLAPPVDGLAVYGEKADRNGLVWVVLAPGVCLHQARLEVHVDTGGRIQPTHSFALL